MRDLSGMTREELERYIEFMLWQYRVVDGYWFMAVEDEYGLEAAVKLNEKIWGRIGARAARDIKERFKIEGEGVSAVMEALSYFPWSLITKFEVEKSEGGVVLRVPSCPPQEARVRLERGEFPCKPMQIAEFSGFAKEIDERVEVICRYAPPDPHPKDVWCEWEFRLKRS